LLRAADTDNFLDYCVVWQQTWIE